MLSEIFMLLEMTDIFETLFPIFDVEPYKKMIFYTKSKNKLRHVFQAQL